MKKILKKIKQMYKDYKIRKEIRKRISEKMNIIKDIEVIKYDTR